ncbi:MAG: AAA family ATPase [Myxococcales bacterium]|nr:AAA family ATPase [Myxococcales bacterium]
MTAPRIVPLAAPAPGTPPSDAALADALAVVADAAALTATSQDPGFHAEGDVWLHTRMAVAALVADPAWAALDAAGRAITYAAVLFHDVGKATTTRHEPDGRISSRGHSARGEADVRAALWRAGWPWTWREHVCALVRWHQVPFFGVDRADATALAVRLSLALRHDWLTVVATADAAGRRCAAPDDQRRILDQCALWRTWCDELGVLTRPAIFADAHSRLIYLADTSGTRSREVPAFDDTVAEAVIVCGLPAAGKSSYLATRPELPQVSLDDLRDELDVDPADGQGAVIALARDRAREHLRAGRAFAWNATNLSRTLRAALLGLCRDYRFRTHLVYCEVDPAEQQRRNRARPAAAQVPARAIARMVERWTVPTLDEAHRVSYRVDGATGATAGLIWPPTG